MSHAPIELAVNYAGHLAVSVNQRHADYPGPKFFVRVDNGRDVLALTDYYERSDAELAQRADLIHWRRILEVNYRQMLGEA
jgi:hypothetical protein